MPTWSIVLLLVLAAWVLVMASLRRLSLRLRERAHQAMRRLLGDEEPLLLADANLVGTDPSDLLPPAPHPMGVLALTRWRLHFLPWAAKAPLLVPRPKITGVSLVPEFAGKPLPAPGLLVDFTLDGGTGEEAKSGKVCWLVERPEDWAGVMAPAGGTPR